MSEQLPCPSCRHPMESLAFARIQGGETWLDLCWGCRAIWFDTHESNQLAPAGVVALFQAIHKKREMAQPMAEQLKCPRCTGRLAYGQDMTKSGRFAYYRCAAAHGRFTPFNQFLIEKGFIRALTTGEIATLKAEIKTICCSTCGAPVELQRDTVCGHCHSPIAILDTQAVEKALAAYGEAGKLKSMREHDVVAGLILQRERERLDDRQAERVGVMDAADAVDLIASGIGVIVEFWG